MNLVSTNAYQKLVAAKCKHNYTLKTENAGSKKFELSFTHTVVFYFKNIKK